MGHMKKKRLREKKAQNQKDDPLKGWTMKSEPIKDWDDLETKIEGWLAIEGTKVFYDDNGQIEGIYHPSCESDPNPHFHTMIVEMKEKKQP